MKKNIIMESQNSLPTMESLIRLTGPAHREIYTDRKVHKKDIAFKFVLYVHLLK